MEEVEGEGGVETVLEYITRLHSPPPLTPHPRKNMCSKAYIHRLRIEWMSG